MQFGPIHKKKFGTTDGAYSVVTPREKDDSQITLTDHEARMLISHFGKESLHVGNVKSNRPLSAKPFRLFPNGKTINLNVVFPKPKKTELRLYLSHEKGFMPKGKEIWFMFLKEGDIWIGAMPEARWRADFSDAKRDESDEIYQESVNDTDIVRITKLKERDKFTRDRNIAVKRMNLSGFTCEFDSSHSLFISRFTKNQYLEAHHLIPMGLQGEFKTPLDTIHNVFCLCPYCHRAVHHAEDSLARKILVALAQRRPVLQAFNLTIPDLLALYAVEEITK